jgi:pimeloyl-ACP methyl ester carboxylesterase
MHAYAYTQHIVRALVEAGHPYLAIDAGGTFTWGHDDSIAAVGDGKTYLQGTLGAKAGPIFLFGFSMGALPALNWARQNLASVAAVALICPVVALDWANDNDTPAGAAAQIATAYGGGYEAGLATHDPTAYASELTSLPGKIWRSTDDASVPMAQVDAFAAAADFEVRDLGAVGHSPVSVDAAEVASFFASHS